MGARTLPTEDTHAESVELVVLPPSADKADRGLVNRAVLEIRDIVAKTTARGLDEVGRYLLKEFYDDDPALYHSASPNKHASLSMLVERCESIDLPVSRTFLANALRMAAVSKGLPRAASFHRLPPSHRIELLRVRAPDDLEKLATKAFERKLSVQKLRILVKNEQKATGSTSGRGRPPKNPVTKALEAGDRSLRDPNTGKPSFGRADIAQMTEDQKARARAALASLEASINALKRILR